jgi:hypothetical protein
MTSIVGTLAPGEAFVRMDQDGGRYAINGTSTTWNVQSDPSVLEGSGVAYTQVAFLHTSFPTYGYIGTAGIVDVYTKKFGTVIGSIGSTEGVTYNILETQKTLACDITTSLGELTSMPSGSQIAVAQADMYGNPEQMTIYGFKNSDPTGSNNEWLWTVDSMGWINTGIASGSACPYWGIKLNRTCP